MRRFLIFSIVLVISLTALSTSRALIISVFQFKSSDITPLNYAENDAKRFKEALIFLDLVPEENIKFLENPTLAEMRVAIREFFSEAKSGDVLYFFYSGHGYYDEKSSRTYLIPWDVDPAYLRETAYPVEDSLKDLLLRSGIKVFMFIDACYSGSIGKDKPLRFRHFSEESLKEIVSRSNVGLLLSSDEDEVSKEDKELEGGVFTYYLVRGMKGEANLDGDERITLEELARYVRDKVSERTHGAQHPQVIASAGIEGEVVVEDYTKIELKALERLRNLSGIPDEVKGVVGKIVMQTPEKDTEIERKVRRYIRRYGLGEIGSDILVDLIEANLDKLEVGEGYSVVSLREEGKGFGTLKIHIEVSDITKDAVVIVGGRKKPVKNLVIFEEVPAGKIKVVIDGPYMERCEKQVDIPALSTKEISVKPEKASAGLVVDSDPEGAEVYIDGEKLPYKTPFTTKIQVGRHVLEIRKTGYISETVVIDLKKGEVYKLKNIKLKRKPERLSLECPEVLFVGEEKNCKVKAVFELSHGKEEEEEISASELKVSVVGDAVSISDGKIKALSPGKARLRFEYRGKSLEREITVYYGKIYVKSDPSGAEVYINGAYKGITPLSVYVENREIRLTLRKAGCETLTKDLTFKPGERKELHITLSEKIKDIEVNIPDRMLIGDKIRLNVKAIGYYTRRTLDVGEYSVDISNKGVIEYRDGKLIAKNPGDAVVTIRYGAKKSIRRTIRVYYSSVYISSDPSGADIYVDGRYVGTTPKRIYIQQVAQNLSIKLTKSKYESVEKTIYISKGSDKRVHIKLNPKPVALHLYIPREVEIGKKVQKISIKLEFKNGETRYLSKNEVKLRAQGSLEMKGEEIVAKDLGKGSVTVEYRGLSDTKEVNVYKIVKITSDPPNANVYTSDGKYLGVTPLDLKLYKSSEKIVLKKDIYQTTYKTISRDQDAVHIQLELALADVIDPLLKKGKISEVTRVIKKAYEITGKEEAEILKAIKDFDEESLRDMRCETEGGRLLKEYVLRYISEVKRAISSMDAEKTSELLNEIRPNVAKELLRDEKPWAWALKKAFDEDYFKYGYYRRENIELKGLSKLLSRNGELQGASVKKDILPPKIGTVSSPFSEPTLIDIHTNLIDFSSSYIQLPFVGLVFWRVVDKPYPVYVDFGLGIAEWVRIFGQNYGGYFPIEVSILKPVIFGKGDLLNSTTAFYLRAGTQLLSIRGGGPFIKIEGGISVLGFSLGATFAVAEGYYSSSFHIGLGFAVELGKNWDIVIGD